VNSKGVSNVFALIFMSSLASGCYANHAESVASISLRKIASPAAAGSFSPRVTSRSDGSVILSWLEPHGDTAADLRFSIWQNEGWSEPIRITAAQPFSRHPSESPGVIALSDRNLIAYWSQRPPYEKISTQEVDVYFAVSTDRGVHWTAPTLANRAGTGEENSYPSAARVDDTHAALIWLDGTNWKTEKRAALMSRLWSRQIPVWLPRTGVTHRKIFATSLCFEMCTAAGRSRVLPTRTTGISAVVL
jgi:hypothetical protein